jgi:hypothetical protein
VSRAHSSLVAARSAASARMSGARWSTTCDGYLVIAEPTFTPSAPLGALFWGEEPDYAADLTPTTDRRVLEQHRSAGGQLLQPRPAAHPRRQAAASRDRIQRLGPAAARPARPGAGHHDQHDDDDLDGPEVAARRWVQPNWVCCLEPLQVILSVVPTAQSSSRACTSVLEASRVHASSQTAQAADLSVKITCDAQCNRPGVCA